MQWGDRIEVDGVRPDWLRDDTTQVKDIDPGTQTHGEVRSASHWGWSRIKAIRLPADHEYYKRTNDDTVSVRRMSEAEAHEIFGSYSYQFEWAKRVGLIREPTEAERIAAQTGVPLPTVQAVLDARAV